MELLEWNETSSVGVEILDRQHRRIIHAINKLSHHPGENSRSVIVSEILNEITEYASDHFTTEEKILSYHNYPEMENQEESHRLFRKKIVQFCVAVTEQVDFPTEVILDFLKEWWQHHIHEEDMLFRDFLNQKGVR